MMVFKYQRRALGRLPQNVLVRSLLLIAAMVLPVGAATTILVEENFTGTGADLPTAAASYYDAALTAAGGSANWGGSPNVEEDGNAYGNNAKVTYLNLGSYIDDTKGTANGLFELTATISKNDDPNRVKGHFNFLSFANTSSPASATTAHTVGSIGTKFDGSQVAYSFENSLGNLQTKASTIGPHTVTIALDLTATYYNGSSQFGQITVSDSVEGVLGSSILTADQSFAAITMIIDGTFLNRTGTKYSALTLSQIDGVPEPAKGTVIIIK